MQTKRQRSIRKKRKDIVGVVLITLAAALILAFIGSYAYFSSRAGKINKETLCPEAGVTETTAILIDRTDALNPTQRIAIRNHLDDLRAGIPPGGEVVIYSVGPTMEDLLKPEFRMCNPGSGSNANEFYENPKLLEKRWREGFLKPLQKTLESMLVPNSASISPIMESIQSVVLTSFAQHKSKHLKLKRLVLVSDLLHNTSEFSHYRGDLDFKHFRKNPYYRKVRGNFDGIEVVLLYIRRDTPVVQGRKHIQFWQEYFADQGGLVKRVVAIEG